MGYNTVQEVKRPYNEGPQCDAPKREGDVPTVMGEVRHQLESLTSTVQALLARLAPVTEDTPNGQGQCDPKVQPGRCALSRELYIIRDTLGEMESRVRSALSHLEL